MQPRTLAISTVALTLVALLAVTRGGCAQASRPRRARAAGEHHSPRHSHVVSAAAGEKEKDR